MYGNQRVYTTNRQNFELHGVDAGKIDELKKEVHKQGFQTEHFFGLDDIVVCVGTTYCPKAVSTTRELYDELKKLVGHKKYHGIQEKAFINITGCPNSCSPYRISDMGFRGTRIREEQGSVEGYEMLVAGSETDHGKKLGDFKMKDCVKLTQLLLDFFNNEKRESETLGDFVNRIGIEKVKEELLS